AGSIGQRAEDLLRLGLVRRAALPLEFQREREGSLQVWRIEFDRAPPVADGCPGIALLSFRECQQPLYRGVSRREFRCAGDVRDRLVDLLLPQQQQTQVRPTSRLRG